MLVAAQTGSGGRMPHLDMVRGLAALAVCIGHLRGFFLVDYGQIRGGLVAKSFYLLTGLHHEAVMIFFVLSGFLVGGSVVRLERSGTWRWGDYLVRRLSRLWVVIVPALLLTLAWDLLGRRLDPAGYAGAYFPQLLSGPVAGNDRLTAINFLGNLAFLQQIRVNSFGTNGPLWSLAAEFWYYVLFPLGIHAVFRGRTLATRVLALVLIAVICHQMSSLLLSYAVIWLFGVAAFVACDHAATARFACDWRTGMAGLIMLVIALPASRLIGRPGAFAVGAAFAIALPWLARAPAPSRLYTRVARALSEMSYTLYLVHFPLLAWIYFVFVAPAQWDFTVAAVARLAGILLLVMIYAGAIWWLFERNTDRVRAFFEKNLYHHGLRRTDA